MESHSSSVLASQVPLMSQEGAVIPAAEIGDNETTATRRGRRRLSDEERERNRISRLCVNCKKNPQIATIVARGLCRKCLVKSVDYTATKGQTTLADMSKQARSLKSVENIVRDRGQRFQEVATDICNANIAIHTMTTQLPVLQNLIEAANQSTIQLFNIMTPQNNDPVPPVK